MKFDHLLLIGFGGPEKVADVRPFLEKVAEGRAIPETRLKEVEHHYEVIGGHSPYNAHAMNLKKQLETALRLAGIELPVFIGMRNWHPFLKETLSAIDQKGYKRGLGLILSVQRSLSSCARYKEDVSAAKKAVGADLIAYEFIPAWYAHPLFIEAQASQIQQLLTEHALAVEDVHLVFTVHSIPVEMAQGCTYCDYRAEFDQSSRLVAERLKASAWSQAYQSRSGNPRQPWLEPDISEELSRLAQGSRRTVVAVPIGFLFDNAEVLFDLDVEARQRASQLGLDFLRAPTVMGHPLLLEMLRNFIVEMSNVR